MMKSMHGFHHVRARVSHAHKDRSGLEAFPSENTFKRYLDYLMYAVGLLAPLALLPQVFEIYSARSAEGFSVITWALLVASNVLWALYGLVHRESQLVLAHCIFAFFDGAVLAAIFLFS